MWRKGNTIFNYLQHFFGFPLLDYLPLCMLSQERSRRELSEPIVFRIQIQKFMAKKVTSKQVATKASKVLRDDRYGKTTKSVAGSALSQREKK